MGQWGLRQIQARLAYLSGRAKRLFIHIPKNAGTAIRKDRALRWRVLAAEPFLLRSATYRRELLAAMAAAGEHHGFQHARLRDVAPKVRACLPAFAVVRNPWARTVSRYRFALQTVDNAAQWAKEPPASFEAFLEERHTYGGRPFYWHRAVRGWYPQADYVVDEEGKIALDVLRQEALGQDITRYLSLERAPERRNVTRVAQQPYQAFYSKETIQIVADWYQADIEMFGFDFDTGATRNFWAEGME